MPYPWQRGHLIQGQYLNSLQDLLADWSDNVLLQYSGASIIIPASATAPAELVIEGQLRYSDVTITGTVSGPAGTYNIYATTKRGRVDFAIAASPGTPTAQYKRLLGTAEFDGTNITDVTSVVREINVSHIDGHPPSQTPIAAGIPAGRADGSLDPGWFDGLDDVRVPIGGVREVWVPVDGTFAIPSDWRVCDGQVVPAGQHDFPILGPDGSRVGTVFGAVTLPDMRNKHVRGGGSNAVGGSNGALNLNHVHGVAAHGHTVADHVHGIDAHAHVQPLHSHNVSGVQKYNISTADPTDKGLGDRIADIIVSGTGNLTLSTDAATSGGAEVAPADTPGGIPTLSTIGGQFTSAGPSGVTVTPLSRGFVYIMRVI